MVTGINSGYYNDFYNKYGNVNQMGASSPYLINNSGVYNPQKVQPEKKAKVDKYAYDDGKISFGSKVKNFAKGIGKFFTGMVTDENGHFSLGKTIKTALTIAAIGAVCVLTAGTAVPALIAAGGVLASGFGIAKGAVRAASATTDAEAEAAWQSIGSSTTALGLAAVGARAVAKGTHGASAGKYDGAKGLWNGVKDSFVDSYNAVGKFGTGVKTSWQASLGKPTVSRFKAVKDNVVEQGRAFDKTVKANYKKATTNIEGKIKTENEYLENQKAKYQERADKAKNDRVKEFYQKKVSETQAKIEARNEMNNAKTFDEGTEILNTREAEIAELQKQYTEAVKAKSSNVNDIKAQLDAKISQTKVQREVLNRKVAETNAKEIQIETKQAKLENLKKAENPDAKAIAKLEAEINTLKSEVYFRTDRTAIRENIEFNKELITERQAQGVDQIEIDIIKDYIADLQKSLKETGGNVKTQAVKEILTDARYSPIANWLTLANVGKKEWAA